MQLFRKKKLIVLWFLFCLVIVAVVGFLYLRSIDHPLLTLVSFQKSLQVIDRHPAVTLIPKRNLTPTDFGEVTSSILSFHNIEQLNVAVTDQPVQNTYAVFDGSDNQLNYTGYSVHDENGTLLVELYLNQETVRTLQKTEGEVVHDLLVQFFVAIHTFNESKTNPTNTNRVQEEYDELLSIAYDEAGKKASSLISSGNIPFTVNYE